MLSMNPIKGILLSLIACLMVFTVQAQEAGSGYFSHTVMRGQTLSSISNMYHVSISDIVSLNPGSDKQIRAGETLRIPQRSASAEGGTVNRLHFHTIQAGETLYRLTTQYRVSAEAICRANPGLSAANFRAGQVIVIPLSEQTQPQEQAKTVKEEEEEKSPCREMHKVKRKETIFSISREYGISEKELIDANPELKKGKLKRGTFICIPHKRKPMGFAEAGKRTQPAPTNEELFRKSQQDIKKLKSINAALMLPFQPEASGSQQALMVEYYEGLLLAIDSLKSQGVNINLHVYNTGGGTQSIAPLLAKEELKGMDIIFGPKHSEHVKPLSDFAKEHQIRLVLPFTSKDSEVFSNPYIYQINTPQSYLFSQVHKIFADNFSNYNIIFIEVNDGKDKTEFIKGLKQELDSRNIAHRTMAMPQSPEQVTLMLDATKPNMVIPTSGTNVSLIKLLPILQLVVRTEENPYEMHLFGYPEWQMYYNDHLQAFYELDTYFYSSFYTNNLLPAAKAYHSTFRRWFGKEMIHTFPKCGMLGFDTGYYFIKGLHHYGTQLEEKLDKVRVEPVQTGFRFERVNNWGGFINKKVFFIHMTRNHELIKLDFE